MKEIARILTLLLICKACSGQFFYNYEAEEPSHPQASGEAFDPSHYQYVPPSAVEERYPQPQREPQPLQNSDNLRRRSGRTQRVDVTEVLSEDQYYQQQPLQPQYAETGSQSQEEPRNNRKNNNRRQRQRARYTTNRDLNQEDMRQPQRQYTPSVFENIGLGEAPSGVNVPEDSLLNILRSNNPANFNQPRRVQQAPSIQYTASQPSREQYYEQQTQPQSNLQNTESIRHNRGLRHQIEVAEALPDEQYYKQQLPQPQNAQPEVFETQDEIRSSRRNVRKQRVSSRNTWDRNIKQIEVLQNQRQYAPSIFANIGLGEAPSGVDVPEDSLLNILRTNNRAVHYIQPQHISQASTVQRVISPQPSRRTRNPQYTDIREPQSLSYENQRTSTERSPTQQFYAQPPVSSEQSHQNIPDRHAAHPKSEPQEEILRNPQRHRQQSSPRFAQTLQQHRRRDGDVRRRAPPPPQTVYEVPEPKNDVSYTVDYEDDIIRQRPRNANSRPRQQVNSSQNQQFANDHQTTPAPRQKTAFKTANLAIASLPDDTDEDGIPGQARADYPTLHVIPTTSFSCAEQPYNGYYADLETSCQVVHLCQAGGVQSSFLCPNGTIFSQEKFSCQWWYKVDCANSPKFYGINDSLYKVPLPPSRKKNR